MKIDGKTFRQWASEANALVLWRKRLANNTKKNLGRLGTLLTTSRSALQPPKKGHTKRLVVQYIGGATDEKTLQKHITRIAKVLEIGDLDTTYMTEPAYTLNLGRLEVRVKFVGLQVAQALPAPESEVAPPEPEFVSAPPEETPAALDALAA